MKIGQRVMTPDGSGVFKATSGTGRYLCVDMDDTREERWYPTRKVVSVDAAVADASRADAVVGEACEASLRRLQVALGCDSIMGVEAAVMALLCPALPHFEPLTVEAVDAHDGLWMVKWRTGYAWRVGPLRRGEWTQDRLGSLTECGMPLGADGQPTVVSR